MAPVELVPADTPALLAELSALAHVIWHQHYAPIIGREQVEYMLAEGYSEAALARQWAAGTRFTLARHDARYVGFAAVSLDPVDAAMAWLDKLYVHIDARGLGVGRRLVARAAAQAREADARSYACASTVTTPTRSPPTKGSASPWKARTSRISAAVSLWTTTS